MRKLKSKPFVMKFKKGTPIYIVPDAFTYYDISQARYENFKKQQAEMEEQAALDDFRRRFQQKFISLND